MRGINKMREEFKKITELEIENSNIKRDILEMVKKYPNNFILGEKVRSYSYQLNTTDENQLNVFDDQWGYFK